MIGLLLALAAAPHWTINEIRDSMTDEVEIHAALEGSGGTLIYMCSHTTSPLIIFKPTASLQNLPDRAEGRQLQYRFDDSSPVTIEGSYSQDYAGIIDADQVTSFLAGLRASRRLRVRALSYSHDYRDGDFDLSGAADALRRADTRCHSQSMTERNSNTH